MKKMILISILFALQTSNTFAAGSYPFTVKESGSGPAIIFIPGFACSGDVWNETVETMKGAHKCYVINMAGFADATPETKPEISNWVKQIAAFIRENKIERPVIVGHSLGGVMAQWLAADYPQLVSKIVVVDALPCLPAISNPGFTTSTEPDCGMFTGSFLTMKDPQFYQMQRVTMASMVSDTSRLESIVHWSMQSDRNTMAQIYCQLLNTDLRQKIHSVQCPVLVLLEPSFKSLQGSVEDQYKELKGAKLHFANRGLHFIMYDQSVWYVAELKNFIQ